MDAPSEDSSTVAPFRVSENTRISHESSAVFPTTLTGSSSETVARAVMVQMKLVSVFERGNSYRAARLMLIDDDDNRHRQKIFCFEDLTP